MDLPVGRDLEPGLREPFELRRVRVEVDPLRRSQAVAPHRKRPGGGDRGVELANRARGRVAGVGERRLAGLRALLVEGGEGRSREVDLAAHLDERRRVLDPERDRLDRAQVLGHALPDLAVAAGGPAGKDPVLVDERDRQAVDLRLRHVLDLLERGPAVRSELPHPRVPGAQLLLVARVGERVHRPQVADRLELVERLGSHSLRGRVRCTELGMLLLEVAQLVQQRVVVGVRDLGVVEDVVAVVVVLDDPPQLGGALLYRCERPFHLAIAV